MTMWYEFSQNNSGGAFDIDDEKGIGPRVWIEADNAEHANKRALEIGLYFYGVAEGKDCPCCGDRWHEAYKDSDGLTHCEIDPRYDFNWHDKVFAHPLEGAFEYVTQDQIGGFFHVRIK